MFIIKPRGRCGSLALFWKSCVDMEFLFVDKNLLDVKVQFGSSSFFISCVYGNPDVSIRPLLWERMSQIGTNRKESVCVFGDFNDIMHNGEKIGGPMRNDYVHRPFNDMLRCCELSELPSSGNSFTWGGRRHELWIQCKLDRCFGNK